METIINFCRHAQLIVLVYVLYNAQLPTMYHLVANFTHGFLSLFKVWNVKVIINKNQCTKKSTFNTVTAYSCWYQLYQFCINVIHTHVEIVSTLSPCALVCQSNETNQLVLRSNTVTDGTPCYSGTFDHALCIEGACRVSYVPSYLILCELSVAYKWL